MEMAIGGGGGDLFGSWTGAVPWTGVPLAGVPLTGVPLNGAVPLTDGSQQAQLYHQLHSVPN